MIRIFPIRGDSYVGDTDCEKCASRPVLHFDLQDENRHFGTNLCFRCFEEFLTDGQGQCEWLREKLKREKP